MTEGLMSQWVQEWQARRAKVLHRRRVWITLTVIYTSGLGLGLGLGSWFLSVCALIGLGICVLGFHINRQTLDLVDAMLGMLQMSLTQDG